MRAAIILTFVCLLFTSVNAQMLRVKCGEFSIDEPHFDQDFIARNEIWQIKGTLATKKEMEPIRQKTEHYHYEFDEQGELVLQMTMMGIPGTGKDTSLVRYEYDDMGALITKRRNDPYGFFSYEYEYDSLCRQTESAYFRDENTGPSRYEFAQGERFSITSESFSYKELGPGLYEKTVYNNYGDPYMKERWEYDSLGYLVEVASYFPISNRRSKVSYKYDELGRAIERTTINDLYRGDVDRVEYEYDEVGLLLNQKVYRNEKQVKLIEYLYDQGTMLLKAELTKVMDNNFIRIIQYQYLFNNDRGTGVATSE